MKLVWIDLELTGLDVDRDTIIEIAVVLSDTDINSVVPGPNIIIHCHEELLNSMSSFVNDMHTNSGLIYSIRNSRITLKDAEQQVIEFLTSNEVTNGILSGNSVHMDRLFLLKHMPNLFTQWLHPVSILDVSTFKQLFSAWNPLFEAQPKRSAHRSLEDITASIQELQSYKRKYIDSKII